MSGHAIQLCSAALALVCCAAFCGCHAKPDHLISVPSNDPNIFYTIESSDGHGPLDSGTTDVYAHLKSGNASDRKLVLHGLYLNTRVTWVDRDNVSLCLADGLTSEYYNVITLNAGPAYRTIHNHLKENC
jgi:hypothetical protein